MKHKAQIEAALERSLREQVNVRRLDSRFDASVWARIEADESRSAALQAPVAVHKVARLLQIFNVVGLASVAIFASFYGAQMLAGADIAISMPEFSEPAIERIAMTTSAGIAGASMIFGLMFTPWGRRLRDELS